jgi:Mg2+ and Co2+ transporter CorA
MQFIEEELIRLHLDEESKAHSNLINPGLSGLKSRRGEILSFLDNTFFEQDTREFRREITDQLEVVTKSILSIRSLRKKAEELLKAFYPREKIAEIKDEVNEIFQQIESHFTVADQMLATVQKTLDNLS